MVKYRAKYKDMSKALLVGEILTGKRLKPRLCLAYTRIPIGLLNPSHGMLDRSVL